MEKLILMDFLNIRFSFTDAQMKSNSAKDFKSFLHERCKALKIHSIFFDSCRLMPFIVRFQCRVTRLSKEVMSNRCAVFFFKKMS